jgi:hypothetical protein
LHAFEKPPPPSKKAGSACGISSNNPSAPLPSTLCITQDQHRGLPPKRARAHERRSTGHGEPVVVVQEEEEEALSVLAFGEENN